MIISRNKIKNVGLGAVHCCYYDDLEKYRKYDYEKYISTSEDSTYLQSYKYFQPYRNQLLNYYLLFNQSYIDDANDVIRQFTIDIDDLKHR
jgi:hypothetical protein